MKTKTKGNWAGAALSVVLFAGVSRADHLSDVSVIVDGTTYQCSIGGGSPPPAFKLYCSCSEGYGVASLNLMAFNSQTGEEKKVRKLAHYSGTAVHPGMEVCRQAAQSGDFPECRS